MCDETLSAVSEDCLLQSVAGGMGSAIHRANPVEQADDYMSKHRPKAETFSMLAHSASITPGNLLTTGCVFLDNQRFTI